MDNNDDDKNEKNEPTVIRPRNLPEWRVDNKGRKRGLDGRWSRQRAAEFFEENPSWQTLDDIGRAIYGTTRDSIRKNVRKHIPPQRKYMMYVRQRPIVTQYGQGSRIIRVKLYDPTDENDRVMLQVELSRALEKKEVSEKRYEDLLKVFLLMAPDVKQSA